MSQKTQSRRTLAIYGAIFLVVVVAMILLSYFIARRNDRQIETMYAENAAALGRVENLQLDNVELRTKNTALENELAALETQMEELRQQMETQEAQAEADLKAAEARHRAEYDKLLREYNALLKQSPEI